MSYRFRDSGEGDRRVRRTRTHLKEAFLEALEREAADAEHPLNKRGITVTELAEAAEINRKTFYLHYSGVDALVSEIAEDAARTVADQYDGDLRHDILIFYEFLSTKDVALHTLLTAAEYRRFQCSFYHEAFSSGSFGEYARRSDCPEIIIGYFNCIPGLYYRYMDTHPEETDLGWIAEKTADLVLQGTRGGIAQHGYFCIRYTGRSLLCRVA